MISVGLSSVACERLVGLAQRGQVVGVGDSITFQPRPSKRVATSSLKASCVCPSIVIVLSS